MVCKSKVKFVSILVFMFKEMVWINGKAATFRICHNKLMKSWRGELLSTSYELIMPREEILLREHGGGILSLWLLQGITNHHPSWLTVLERVTNRCAGCNLCNFQVSTILPPLSASCQFWQSWNFFIMSRDLKKFLDLKTFWHLKDQSVSKFSRAVKTVLTLLIMFTMLTMQTMLTM